MIMRSGEVFSVFTAVVVENFFSSEGFPEAFEEFGNVIRGKRAIRRKIVVSISESDKAIVIMETRFVHHASSPLLCSIKAAAYTLTAWDNHFSFCKVFLRFAVIVFKLR